METKFPKFGEWSLVGTIVGTKGLGGMLKVQIEAPILIEKPAVCLVGFSINYANEYLIERWGLSNSRYSSIKLKGIDDIEQAKKLIEMGIFVRKDAIKPYTSRYPFEKELYDFVVVDINDNTQVGKVVDIEENPGNNLLVVEQGKKLIYIPFISQFISKIDSNNKIVFIKSIEGLLDL